MRFAAACLCLMVGTLPAMAEDRAVIIGNADYESAPDLAGSDTAALAKSLRDAGFVTQDGVDLQTAPMRGMLEALVRADDAPGVRIVILNGRFVHDTGETWFLGTEAVEPGPLSAGTRGVPLSLVMRLMASADPGAVLMLGTDGQQMPHRRGLANGIGLRAAPDGVSVVLGTPEAGARAVAELLHGATLTQAVGADPALHLLPGSRGALVLAGSRAGDREAEDPLAGDRDAWARAAAQDSATAYRAYLADFPRGIYSAAAKERLDQMRAAPLRLDDDRDAWAEAAARHSVAAYQDYLKRFPAGRYVTAARDRLAELRPATRPDNAQPTQPPAQAAEQALRLTPAQRMTVQRQLARLGHQPGVADGVFGMRTRRAILAWQTANGVPGTGFLTRAQMQMIAAQAERRAGEDAARDRNHWQQTGARGDVAGLRAYLARYPNGAHADEARRRLARLGAGSGDSDAGDAAPRGDRATWRWAREQGTGGAYETYLERFPDGAHADEARALLATLRAGAQAARAEEESLRLPQSARRVIEERLRAAGMRPGTVDGEFDAQSRAALRRYQAARNLRVTGYVTQQTVSTLLSDALRP